MGVPVEEIRRGIAHGVRKINVDTDNRLAITAAIRKVLWESPEKFDPRDYLKPAREAMRAVCKERMTQFGQAGNAGKIKPVTPKEFAKVYGSARRIGAGGRRSPFSRAPPRAGFSPGRRSSPKVCFRHPATV